MRRLRLIRTFLWICVLMIAAAIFLFSSQNADASSQLSDSVLALVRDLLTKAVTFFLGHTPKRRELSFIIRKIGHFTEFMILCFFLRLLLQTYRIRFASCKTWAISTIYAMTDEFHQLFSSGRAGQWQDVLIDSSGALTGLLLALLVLYLYHCICRWRASRRRMS